MGRFGRQQCSRMHTDEYEISLGRELAVCEQYVRKYRNIIADMEGSQAPAGSGDREQAYAELRHWTDTRDEYARLLREMRISR